MKTSAIEKICLAVTAAGIAGWAYSMLYMQVKKQKENPHKKLMATSQAMVAIGFSGYLITSLVEAKKH